MNLRFPSLSSGDYLVEVIGVLSSIPFTKVRTLSFSISKPWWQTTLARLIGILGVLLLMLVVIWIRGKRLKKEEEAKRDYIQQINAVRDQALQLQMNPHFIFNAMNAIQSFITSNKEEDATLYLAKFAKLIRLIFEYSNTNLITLEAELNFVNLYLELENLRFKGRVTSNLTVDDELNREKDILHIPPLIIQPVIENSFKHGLFHKLKGGIVNVDYKMIDDSIVITVEDNGIGREASYGMRERKIENDRPSGLKNVSQRLHLLNYNQAKKDNFMKVEDLYHGETAIGTKTTIKITIDENR